MGSILKLSNVIGGTGAVSFSNNYSVLLDGVDEYINIDSVQTALASTTVGTWSCWIKPVDATPTALEVPLSFGDINAATFLALRIETDGKLGAQVFESAATKWLLRTDAQAMSDNTWHHVSLVQDGASPVLYVDGVAVAQTFATTIDKTKWHNTTGLDSGRIGSLDYNSLGNAFFFNGNVDEVLFINRALNATQVADIYNSGIPKDESAIANGVSYFRIDGDTVSTATDSIGSNNGTYVNVEQADIELDTP